MDRGERNGTVLLLAAIALVAGSIVTEGALSRGLNGLAGLAWFGAAAMLAWSAWRTSRRWHLWTLLISLTALVAFVVKPTDFLPAVIGFGLAGAAAAVAGGTRETLWAKLVVGLYLPLHIGTAMLKAGWRTATGAEASIRTEPPPTAALVPLAMFLAAAGGGWLVSVWRRKSAVRGTTNRSVAGHEPPSAAATGRHSRLRSR
jgi:hypothetical protein